MRYLIILSLMIPACGSPLLEPGTYNITGEITESDWGATGNKVEGVWEITEDQGKYTAKFDWADWKFKGKESGNNIVMDHHQDFDDSSTDCDDFNHIDLVLTPNSQANKFEGDWFSELHMCNISPCAMVLPGMPGCEPIEVSIYESITLRGEKQ